MVLYPNKLPESERVCSGICKPEPEQQKGLKGNKGMFNKLFRPLLNDDIISDLEKLYNI